MNLYVLCYTDMFYILYSNNIKINSPNYRILMVYHISTNCGGRHFGRFALIQVTQPRAVYNIAERLLACHQLLLQFSI